MILIEMDNITGDSQVDNDTFKGKCFTADSFGFGVQRDVAESSKAGTYDLKLGVGELQECTIGKSMDSASAYLARFAISGTCIGTTKVYFVETGTTKDNKQKLLCYLSFFLDKSFVKSWSVSGDGDSRPTEEVAVWYYRIAFTYGTSLDGDTIDKKFSCGWDQVANKPWSEGTASSEGLVKVY